SAKKLSAEASAVGRKLIASLDLAASRLVRCTRASSKTAWDACRAPAATRKEMTSGDCRRAGSVEVGGLAEGRAEGVEKGSRRRSIGTFSPEDWDSSPSVKLPS